MRLLRYALLLPFLTLLLPVQAQPVLREAPPPEAFCALPPAPPDLRPSIAAPASALRRSGGTAQFQVDFVGPWPREAAQAYLYAAQIWGSVLRSDVTIRVQANWTDLGDDVLGSAGPAGFATDFEGAPIDSVRYPIALANALAGEDLNGAQVEIVSNFNREFDWYFGTDGEVPGNQQDFVTVVLRELGHGLGFTGAMSFSEGSGEGRYGMPNGFDHWVVDGDADASVLDVGVYPNPSTELGDALLGQRGGLFFAGPSFNPRRLPPLYTPSAYNPGSSYSHFDTGTMGNEVMKHALGAGRAIHNPGAAVPLFNDIGWGAVGTAGVDSEEAAALATEPFVLSAPQPNPLASQGRFRLRVAEPQHVTVAVYDALGREVERLHDGMLAASAPHRFTLDAGTWTSGVYLVRAQGEGFSATRRLVVVR